MINYYNKQNNKYQRLFVNEQNKNSFGWEDMDAVVHVSGRNFIYSSEKFLYDGTGSDYAPLLSVLQYIRKAIEDTHNSRKGAE